MRIRHNNHREKGASLFIAIAALVWVVIPMLGLVIDLGIVYSAKARLQAAVDGAALAAARALNLGQGTMAQEGYAQQNAVNWFYANFPNANWNTTGTVMNTGTVTVADSPNSANLRLVTVTATTNVPAWFMKYLGFSTTPLAVTGQASRRDVVAMLVLDRSGSMCSINGVQQGQPCGKGSGTACDAMITAAKVFTGAFAGGRDQIGMLTFSDGSYTDLAPTTDFQTDLGYNNDQGNGTGYIDNIKCGGGTGTAEAVSRAYNELYKINEPGAMNFIILETDGMPNTLVYNWWDGASAGVSSSSSCTDKNGKTVTAGGWLTAASMPTTGWDSPGLTLNYTTSVPTGAIGSLYSTDPDVAHGFILMYNPWQTSSNKSNNSINEGGNGCTNFNAGGKTSGSPFADFKWLPSQDVFGNQVNPSNAYKSLTLSGGHIVLTGNTTTDWTNIHAAALNATDNSAYNVRANATLPAYMYVIGLGGNSGTPPDGILLQRMANDPNGDQFNPAPTPPALPAFQACSAEPTCVNYPNQPEGLFIYSPDTSQLGQAFLTIASQVLRLSQ